MKLNININMKSIKGYTLVELLISVALISVLAASSLVLYSGSQRRARDAVREGDMLAIRAALEQYQTQYQQYPKPNDFSASIFGEFLPSIPEDPSSQISDNETQFGYAYAAAAGETNDVEGQEYELSANLETVDADGSSRQEMSDNGSDTARWELGTNTDFVHSNLLQSGITCADENEYIAGDGGQGACVLIDAL